MHMLAARLVPREDDDVSAAIKDIIEQEQIDVRRAVEKGETLGFMKVVVDRDTKRILGASILGTSGDEAIHSITATNRKVLRCAGQVVMLGRDPATCGSMLTQISAPPGSSL